MAVDSVRTTQGSGPAKAVSQATSYGDQSELRHRGAAVRRQAMEVTKPGSSNDNQQGSNSSSDSQLSTNLANFVETIEIQVVGIGLIAFDLVSAIVSIHFQSQEDIRQLQLQLSQATATTKAGGATNVDFSIASTSSLLISVTQRLLDTVSGFTIVLFILELAVLAVAFRLRFVSHFGYMLDLMVVTVSIIGEIFVSSKAVRLLGLLRLWRVFRLVGTLINRERREHERTLDALETERTRALKLQVEKQAAADSLKREYESRAGMERMLQGYKDEADTLREALNIAAQAVAEATLQTIEEGDEDMAPLNIAPDPQSEEAVYADHGEYYTYDESQPQSWQAEETHWGAEETGQPTHVEVRPAEDATAQSMLSGGEEDDREFADAMTDESGL